jgi:hypothetical protein
MTSLSSLGPDLLKNHALGGREAAGGAPEDVIISKVAFPDLIF